MPFAFKELCVLLERLEHIELHERPLPAEKPARYEDIVSRWFGSHRRQINDLDIESLCALLSSLLPHWRTDRVYGLQADRLCKTLGRALGFSTARRKLLAAYVAPGSGDLARCFERVHAEGGPPAIPAVMMEDVDHMLYSLAGHSNFSDPAVPRLPPGSSETRDRLLSNVFLRATATEGKWLIRLILKDFRPVQCDDNIILRSFHFLMPDLLRFQCDFGAAVTLLKTQLQKYPEKPDRRSEALHRKSIADAQLVKPVVGTKISRPHFHKGRSIDACMKMMGPKPWVLERKYDGEYCEIHVDLQRSSDPLRCIKIFSKSGKDSTRDRKGIHQTLVESLRLGAPDCQFKKRAILLGELVVFSDREDSIMPFEELRKHVQRSGVFIGTQADSLPQPHEHLALVFFDLLLLDDELVMNSSVDERRVKLRNVYKKIPGRAIGAEWTKIDFADPERARRLLLQHFSMANAKRCEGVVLKPCHVPYFSIEASPVDYRHSFIKLKKDYILGLGDEEDFAVIGGSYKAQQAATVKGNVFLKWTSFHLGCLTNRDDVRLYQARPVFKHVGVIDQEHCVPRAVLEAANLLGNLCAVPWKSSQPTADFDIECPSTVSMSVIFNRPLVFEVLGSGYERPSACNHFMLRHPRVKKLHEDRDWTECVTYKELQDNAKASRAAPADSESQEMQRWIAKLERRCKREVEKERLLTSSRTTTSPATRSSQQLDTSRLASSPLRSRHVDAKPALDLHACFSSTRTANDEGQTLLQEHRRLRSKRKSENENCEQTPIKCPRLQQGKGFKCQEWVRAVSSPLSEITNGVNGPQKQHVPGPKRRNTSATVVNDLTIAITDAIEVHGRTIEESQHSQAEHERSRKHCERSTKCPFRNAIVFLAPCIDGTPYIVHNLLGSHEALISSALFHWDRESFSHGQLTHIVSESQSHPGMRKVVLVESKRTRATREILRQVNELNRGQFRERIEVYDWRVLESCQEHDRGAERLKMHFLGATLFDDTRGRALFVGEREWAGA